MITQKHCLPKRRITKGKRKQHGNVLCAQKPNDDLTSIHFNCCPYSFLLITCSSTFYSNIPSRGQAPSLGSDLRWLLVTSCNTLRRSYERKRQRRTGRERRLSESNGRRRAERRRRSRGRGKLSNRKSTAAASP